MQSPHAKIFFGKSQTSQIARSIDWSKHPMGVPDHWDQSLRTSINLALSSAFPMFVAWGKERYFFYNDGYAQILGKKHPEAFGNKFQDIWKEIWDDLFPLVKSVTNDEAVFLEDLKLILNRKGFDEETYFTFSYSPIRSDNGEIEGLHCACVETTDRVIAERELIGREAEVVEVLEGMSDAFLKLDKNWIVKRVNLQFENVVKMKRESVLGKSLFDLFFSTPEQLESLYVKTYKKVMNERIADSFVDYYEPFDIWTAVSAFPTEDGGIAIFFREISKERRAAKDLEDAIKSRDEFISIASHELKTPLTALKLQAEMQKKFGDAYARERLNQNNQKLLNLVHRLDRLVEDMLDISRINTGRLIIQKEETDLVPLFKEVIDNMQASFIAATENKIAFKNSQNAVAFVDRIRIDQVLINLLQNTLKYGSGKPVIVTLDDHIDHIHVSVIDQGMGIASGYIDKIFERFERAINKNEISGLGLGLFISKQIVEAHNGKIWVESVVGKGSTFHMSIPKGER